MVQPSRKSPGGCHLACPRPWEADMKFGHCSALAVEQSGPMVRGAASALRRGRGNRSEVALVEGVMVPPYPAEHLDLRAMGACRGAWHPQISPSRGASSELPSVVGSGIPIIFNVSRSTVSLLMTRWAGRSQAAQTAPWT